MSSRPKQFQSTRPIRGATHVSAHVMHSEPISIHAPHTGRDASTAQSFFNHIVFQSTRPIRGATRRRNKQRISGRNFNPRAPYGARRNGGANIAHITKFQSTRPIRGATTSKDTDSTTDQQFQSTRPIRGATLRVSASITVWLLTFQSTRPIRGATYSFPSASSAMTISIHAPHTGRD